MSNQEGLYDQEDVQSLELYNDPIQQNMDRR